MAVSSSTIRIVRVTGRVSGTSFTETVEAIGTAPNASGNPTVDAYLALEANDGYLPCAMGLDRIVTAKAADINSA